MIEETAYISELLPAYFDGRVSPMQRKAVEEWIAASEENRRVYEDALDVYMDMRALDMMKSVDVEKAVKRVNRRISKRRFGIWMWIQRIAAVLTIPLLVATLWLAIGDRQEIHGTVSVCEICTSRGMTGKVILPDSSVVILNAGSSLSYPSEFSGGSRDVMLNGEAYFEVRKDERRPFNVQTPDGNTIRVYGTRFNLDSYSGDECVATLQSGSIGYIFDGNRKERVLKPGEQLTHNPATGKVSIAKTDTDAATAWKDNRILLDKTSLRHILKVLERKYGVEFIIDNPDINDYTFSGSPITIKGLEYVLETLRISSGIEWRPDPQTLSEETPTTIHLS